ncbi:hypothetical protein GCK72_022499 [Caenorhabditis remanei]|uniref:DDE-1 domain-containing protein n=1 Tax=Caenorhabditis remanei TaxID=31234 RepID=A0A6A5FTW5_CAERE|nr:hypothetical protein GCK72_022499 [Caenorhabditis remanei]KAF1746048.1 hypothetical protein GCK72_022499 [Caenorhabditis remanei]
MVAPFTELYVTNTKSGMMTSDLAIEWLEKVFMPVVPKDSVLILDGWPGWKRMIEENTVNSKNLEFVVLPDGTTSKLQPLDLCFNRQLKNFIRKLETQIRYTHSNIIIARRERQLQIVQYILNQFKAPRYKGLMERGFFLNQILDKRPAYFETPDQYCMNVKATGGKLCANCRQFSYCKCSYPTCGILICASCALEHLHP